MNWRRIARAARSFLPIAAAAVVTGAASVLLAASIVDPHWKPQVAVLRAAVAVWLAQAPVVAMLAGRRQRDDRSVARLRAKVAALTAEGERKDAAIFALEDERAQYWNRLYAQRWANDDRMLPDLRDRSVWADVNRKSDVAAPGVPAAGHATNPS